MILLRVVVNVNMLKSLIKLWIKKKDVLYFVVLVSITGFQTNEELSFLHLVLFVCLFIITELSKVLKAQNSFSL